MIIVRQEGKEDIICEHRSSGAVVFKGAKHGGWHKEWGTESTGHATCQKKYSSFLFITIMAPQPETRSIKVDFPVYGLDFTFDDRIVAVGGGGASSRSGVKNKIVC